VNCWAECRPALGFGHADTDEAHDLAEDGAGALALAKWGGYDAMVLDRMLPDLDGTEVLKLLRSRGDRTPVLLLTGVGSIEQRVAGLDAGADDCLAKPFAFSELLARLRALGRRPGWLPSTSRSTNNAA
jgi:two-component system OmpR family response regulator